MMMGIEFTATSEMEGASLVVFIQPVDRSPMDMDADSRSWGMGARSLGAMAQATLHLRPSTHLDHSQVLNYLWQRHELGALLR